MNIESVSWKFCDQPVTDKLIKEVERMFTIKFPDDYRECAKENNAGQPVPDIFNLSGRGEEVFNSLLSLVSSGSIKYSKLGYPRTFIHLLMILLEIIFVSIIPMISLYLK